MDQLDALLEKKFAEKQQSQPKQEVVQNLMFCLKVDPVLAKKMNGVVQKNHCFTIEIMIGWIGNKRCLIGKGKINDGCSY